MQDRSAESEFRNNEASEEKFPETGFRNSDSEALTRVLTEAVLFPPNAAESSRKGTQCMHSLTNITDVEEFVDSAVD